MKEMLVSKGLNLEVTTFSKPQYLDDSDAHLAEYKRNLSELPSCRILVHGPFIDLNIVSSDPGIAAISRARYLQSIRCARELGAEAITFHTQYNPLLRLGSYIREWLVGTARFLVEMTQDPVCEGLDIYVENMFEDSPDLMVELMKAVDSPRVGITLDVGHVGVYGKGEYSRWIRMMAPYIRHVHLSDNHGMVDEHLPLGSGIVDFKEVFASLARFDVRPTYTIEMGSPEKQQESLDYLDSLSEGRKSPD